MSTDTTGDQEDSADDQTDYSAPAAKGDIEVVLRALLALLPFIAFIGSATISLLTPEPAVGIVSAVGAIMMAWFTVATINDTPRDAWNATFGRIEKLHLDLTPIDELTEDGDPA